MLMQPRGSAHEKAFAVQTHKNRGRVPRFLYFEREKVSAWELSDVRVLRSSKHRLSEKRSFSTVSNTPLACFSFFCAQLANIPGTRYNERK